MSTNQSYLPLLLLEQISTHHLLLIAVVLLLLLYKILVPNTKVAHEMQTRTRVICNSYLTQELGKSIDSKGDIMIEFLLF